MHHVSKPKPSATAEDQEITERSDRTPVSTPASATTPAPPGASIEVLAGGDDLDTGQPGEQAAASPDEDPTAVLRQERNDYHERLLRQAAEFENFRKRTERERRELTESAAFDVLSDLLPIVDDFERALGSDHGPAGESYKRGIEIIYRQLLELLRKRGVKPIESVGGQFDPRVHQAVVHEVSPGHEDGEVIAELRRGYMLGSRLLRPAMVKVAKA
jgi:molecular chaperone GrpE